MLSKKFNHSRLREKPNMKNKPKEDREPKINDGRLRPKPSMKNKPKQSIGHKISDKRMNAKIKHKNRSRETKDPEYLSYLHDYLRPPCFCCGEYNMIELHHIKAASSDPKNDHKVIPRCGEKCHRLGLDLSAHGTPKKFREVFSIEIQEAYAADLYEEYILGKKYYGIEDN